MSFRYSSFYIIAQLLVMFIVLELFSYGLNILFPMKIVLRMILNNIALMIYLFYIFYCFKYRLTMTEVGFSESANIRYGITNRKEIITKDNREYPWDKVSKVIKSSQFLISCIVVIVAYNGKEKRFVISPFFRDRHFIYRKIMEKVDPFFISEEAYDLLR